MHQQQDGTRKYTDQPTHEAQKIQLPTPIMVPSNHQYSPVSALRNNKKPSQRYQSVNIVAPANDVIIRKNSGNVLLKVVIVPDQVEYFNDQIVFIIDQREIARGQARSVTINNMDRGTHEIQVDIEDAHGNTLHSSKKSFIYSAIAKDNSFVCLISEIYPFSQYSSVYFFSPFPRSLAKIP